MSAPGRTPPTPPGMTPSVCGMGDTKASLAAVADLNLDAVPVGVGRGQAAGGRERA